MWDGTRWAQDDEGLRVTDLVMAVNNLQWQLIGKAEATKQRDQHVRWAQQSEKRSTIKATVDLLRSLPGVAVSTDDFDADPWLLNVLNGTVDLRTGELRDHNPDDLITQITRTVYDPHADTPAFQQFLERVVPDESLRGFLQRYAGYTLTGSVREQKILFLTGTGSNGKTILIEAMSTVRPLWRPPPFPTSGSTSTSPRPRSSSLRASASRPSA